MKTTRSWHPHDWNNWRKRHFHPIRQTLDLGRPRPSDLRHSFASLRIREHGASLVDLAAQLGHAPTETLKTYSHVYAQYRRRPPQPADVLIGEARAVHGGTRRDAGRDARGVRPLPNVRNGPDRWGAAAPVLGPER